MLNILIFDSASKKSSSASYPIYREMCSLNSHLISFLSLSLAPWRNIKKTLILYGRHFEVNISCRRRFPSFFYHPTHSIHRKTRKFFIDLSFFAFFTKEILEQRRLNNDDETLKVERVSMIKLISFFKRKMHMYEVLDRKSF